MTLFFFTFPRNTTNNRNEFTPLRWPTRLASKSSEKLGDTVQPLGSGVRYVRSSPYGRTFACRVYACQAWNVLDGDADHHDVNADRTLMLCAFRLQVEGELDMYGAKDVLDQLDVPLGEVKATAAEYVCACMHARVTRDDRDLHCWFARR